MKVKMILILALTLISGFFISCNSSDNDNSACAQDFEGDLTSDEEVMVGKWVLTSVTSDKEIDLTNDEEDNASTNIYAQYSDCQKDSFYILDEDRIMTFIIGSEPTCSFHQENKGTWKLEGDILSLFSTCFLAEIKINLIPDNSAFTTTSNVNIVDVNNVTTAVTIVSTYSREID